MQTAVCWKQLLLDVCSKQLFSCPHQAGNPLHSGAHDGSKKAASFVKMKAMGKSKGANLPRHQQLDIPSAGAPARDDWLVSLNSEGS